MNSYSLKTLHYVREHQKTCAERTLEHAIRLEQTEKSEFNSIRLRLTEKKMPRTQQMDLFFQNPHLKDCSRADILRHYHSQKKQLSEEDGLARSLEEQAERVKAAEQERTEATLKLIDQARALKIIDRHHYLWQKKSRRTEDLKAEYENDDQNGVRFSKKSLG